MASQPAGSTGPRLLLGTRCQCRPRLPAADAAPQLNFLAQQLEWALAQTTQLHHDMAALNVLLVRLNGKN
jgi:hypothetical protein